MTFESFMGNTAAKEQATSFVRAGKFPHALLIEGPEGCGKRTFARLLAQAALCTGAQAPCGECAACRKVEVGAHPDMEELSGGSTARSFHIDPIREMRDRVHLAPNEGARRVFLLFQAHTMTEQAQNALLRILEEPPAHVLFILTCERRAQLLSTIQSRVLCIPLSGVSKQEALPRLKAQFPDKTEEEIAAALTMFDGCVGKVTACLQGDDFAQTTALVADLAAAVTATDEMALLRLTARLEKNSALTDSVLSGLKLVFRDALGVQTNSGATRLSTAPDKAEKLAFTLTGRQLTALVEAVDELQTARRFNTNQALLITLLCARLRAAVGR